MQTFTKNSVVFLTLEVSFENDILFSDHVSSLDSF